MRIFVMAWNETKRGKRKYFPVVKNLTEKFIKIFNYLFSNNNAFAAWFSVIMESRIESKSKCIVDVNGKPAKSLE
jgi:hypothetical protein